MAEVDYEHVSKVYAGGLQAITDLCRSPPGPVGRCAAYDTGSH